MVEITRDELLKLASYDPETGQFYRLGQMTRLNNFVAYDAPRPTGYVGATGYAQIRIQQKLYTGHRLAWLFTTGEWPAHEIDHINGDRSDNRMANLRPANRAENNQNKRRALRNNGTGILGVCFARRENKFRASIKIGGKQKHLGYFNTVNEAADAYLTAKRELHAYSTI